MNFIIGLVIGLIVGFAAGFIFAKTRKPKTSGTFVMDFSDPIKDVCRLELAEDLNVLYQKKYMTLTIETHDAPN